MEFFLFFGMIALFVHVIQVARRSDERDGQTARAVDQLKRRIERLEHQLRSSTQGSEETGSLPGGDSIVAEQEAAQVHEHAAKGLAEALAAAKTPSPLRAETAPLRAETAPPGVAASTPLLAGGDSAPRARTTSPDRPHQRQTADEVETFFGGRVLLVVGVVVALLGVGFFLHLAIQRGWLGPAARLGLTIAAGVASMLGGEHLRRRGYDNYGSALTGGGIGALFLASHFAANVYDFISPNNGFVAGGIVAAFSAWLGVKRSNPFLVHLGFFGAWLAPFVFGKETATVLPLVSWLLAVDLGVLFVRTRLRYTLLDLMAAVASLVYVGGWVMRHPDPVDLTLTTSIVFGAMLARHAIAIVPALVARTGPDAIAVLAGMVAAVLTVSVGQILLMPEHRIVTALILGGFGAVHFAAARVSALLMPDVKSARHAFTAFGLFFLAVAIPHGFEDIYISIAYAACGGALAVLGCDLGNRLLRNAGLAFIVFSALSVVSARRIGNPAEFIPVLNGSFFSRLTPTLAAFFAAHAMRRTMQPDERTWLRAGGVAIAGYYFFALMAAAEAMRFMTYRPNALSHLTGDDGVMLTSLTLALVAVGGITAFRRWMPQLLYSPAIPFIPALLLALPVITEAHLPDFHPFTNVCCLYGLLLAAILFATAILTRPPLTTALRGIAILFAIVTLTFDLHYLGEFGQFLNLERSELEFFSQVSISVLWALCAVGLLKVGFARSSKTLRTAGLILFAITAFKVFLFDLERLDLAWRAASFLGLGVLLVLGSYLYQRKDDGSDGDARVA